MGENKKELVIYWSRRDFRLHDNPALSEAIKYSQENNVPILPLFILEDYMTKASPDFQFGYPQRYFLSKTIPEYAKHFDKFLIIKGKAAESLIEISNTFAKDYALKIFVNEDVYIDFYKQIEKLRNGPTPNPFQKKGDSSDDLNKKIEVSIVRDMMTVDRETVSGTDNYYSVFTPFKKAVWSKFIDAKVYEKVNTKDINYVSNEHFEKICNIFDKEKILLKNNPTPSPFQKKGDNSKLPNEDSSNKYVNNITEENIMNSFNKNRKMKVTDNNNNSTNSNSISTHVFDIDKLLPDIKQDLSIWDYSEEGNLKHFDKYLKENMSDYDNNRNDLEKDLTGKMSPALSWGLVSARTLTKKIVKHFDTKFENVFSKTNITKEHEGAVTYISELIWREFYKYLMYRKPELMNTEFQEKFRATIKWIENKEAINRFEAWIQGKTGYKIVDAAMMQLAKTGWMHNRSRMIVASILTKNLGVDWRWGQEYFRSMLIDLDEASNNGGWQWGASVGADPKPIRIFNPYLQAENYDKNNAYQKKWLSDTDFYFGSEPIVEHKLARDEAIIRYKAASDNQESIKK